MGSTGKGRVPGTPEKVLQLAPMPPPDGTVHRVQIPSSSRRRGADSADAGTLQGVRVQSLQDGVARVRMRDGSVQSLRVGDRVGSDVVQQVSAEMLILSRGGQPTVPPLTAPGTRATAGSSGSGGEVVVKVDGQGRTRVRVYSTADPTALVPPPVIR